MKAILMGYGSMGREVERVLVERGHTIVARVDPVAPQADHRALDTSPAHQAEVAIDFSATDAVLTNIGRYAELGLPAVVGTTGWYGAIEEARRLVVSADIGLVYGPNFSVGAHVFLAVAERAARLLDPLPEYDVSVLEIHHKRKKDSPSGTARSLADVVLASSTRKRTVVAERLDRAIRPEELHIASIRGGEFPGTHTVYFDSLADTIEITHRARSRAGFALGAVLAAEWLGRRKGVYEISQVIRDLLAI